MGMVDLAERLGRPEELQDTLIAEAEQIQRPLRNAVGGAARRAGLRVHRPLPRRGHHPAPQRTRLRRRRSVAATGRRRTRASSNSMSPWVIGATTRSTCRSSPAWTSARDRPASCSAICAPIRRSCAGRSGHDVDESHRRTAVGDRGGDALRAVGARRRVHHTGTADPGLLRSARGALAAQREGGPRRRHQPSARGTGPATSSPPTPPRRWPSPRCRPHRSRSWQSDDDS